MAPIKAVRDMYLRSSTVGTALPRFLSLFTDVTSCGIGSSSTAAGAVVAWLMFIHILHGLVIVTRGSARQVGDLVLHIDFLALQQDIDNLSKLQVTGLNQLGSPFSC